MAFRADCIPGMSKSHSAVGSRAGWIEFAHKSMGTKKPAASSSHVLYVHGPPSRICVIKSRSVRISYMCVSPEPELINGSASILMVQVRGCTIMAIYLDKQMHIENIIRHLVYIMVYRQSQGPDRISTNQDDTMPSTKSRCDSWAEGGVGGGQSGR